MATPVDTLLVRIEADMAGLRRDLNKVQKQTGKVGSAFKGLGRVIAGVLTAAAGVKIINTIRQFEDLQATLVSVTGSAELAGKSFELVRKFTSQTTFQLEQTTGAFITLANAGIAPTSDVLTDVGNLAAAMGQDIRTVARAIFNATTGETEMLKQLGIVARVEGEKLAVTYKGVTETIDRNSDSIVDYIRTLSQENFPDAIEARANTLSGAISNLGDQISEFFMSIGEGGFKDALTGLVRDLSRLLEAARPLGRFIGKVLGVAIEGLAVVLELAAEHAATLAKVMTILTVTFAADKIIAMSSAMLSFAKSTMAGAAANKLLNATLRRNLFLLGAAKLLEFTGAMADIGPATKNAEEAMVDAEEQISALDEAVAAMGVDAGSTGIERINKELVGFQAQLKVAELQAKGFDAELAKILAEAFPEIDGDLLSTTPEERKSLDELYARYHELAAAQERVKRIQMGVELATQGTEADELREKIKALEEAYIAKEIGMRQYQSALKDLKFDMQMTNPIFASMFNALEQAGKQVADSIAESLMKMEFSLSSFNDIAQMLIQKIISQFIQMAIVNRIMNNVFGATLPVIGGGGGGGGKATGGNVNARTPYLVGERGPEMFVPSSAGSIMNSNNTRSLQSGGPSVVVNQTLQIETGVSQTVRAEMAQIAPLIKKDTINAVADARRRGGRFSSAFGG